MSVKLAVCLRSWQIWQGSVNEISARVDEWVDEWVHVAGLELFFFAEISRLAGFFRVFGAFLPTFALI
ncbi:hypothetical protein [Anaerobiospirillum sp. NML120511]|uniref:hypothetical protein n=1 Tax=Anaerobiospirillum sp. NML120511 TaxID=2932819 RepID=UPI001FF4C5C7|nr:hypothetical protein [Anaerobiospirillum sp. NML120511]MCK0535115.1 hypothetical protein [Anaerobiospirillum sp. NML120511]